MSFDDIRKKWNRMNRFDPHVYRVEIKTPLGRMKTEQMEKRWRTETMSKFIKNVPGISDVKILKQNPDRMQRSERKRLGKFTGWLEQLSAG